MGVGVGGGGGLSQFFDHERFRAYLGYSSNCAKQCKTLCGLFFVAMQFHITVVLTGNVPLGNPDHFC